MHEQSQHVCIAMHQMCQGISSSVMVTTTQTRLHARTHSFCTSLLTETQGLLYTHKLADRGHRCLCEAFGGGVPRTPPAGFGVASVRPFRSDVYLGSGAIEMREAVHPLLHSPQANCSDVLPCHHGLNWLPL